MIADLDDFRKAAERRLKEYEARKEGKPIKKPDPAVSHLTGYKLRLAVRKRKVEQDTEYVYISDKTSRLESQIDAERSARKDGWLIISYYIDIEPIYHD